MAAFSRSRSFISDSGLLGGAAFWTMVAFVAPAFGDGAARRLGCCTGFGDGGAGVAATGVSTFGLGEPDFSCLSDSSDTTGVCAALLVVSS